MTESGKSLPHKLTLEEGRRLHLIGAKEVLRFEEDLVELDTARGRLVIQGADLRLKCLSLEYGAVVVEGTVSSLSYEEPGKVRRFFR